MKTSAGTTLSVAALALFIAAADAVETPANKWVKLGDAKVGQRACGALVYARETKRFMVLGGQLRWNAKGDQPYGDLALDVTAGKWENCYPQGKSFGPKFGPCKPPKFKKYYGNLFSDVAGNNRVNQNGHMWRWLYACSAYDTHARQFYFHGSGLTWTYSPLERKWAGVKTATHPAKKTGSNLLWSAMCYDAARKKFVLFGGGNVSTKRGDAGTWTFDPASKTWQELKLKLQPPARANSMLAYDPVAKLVVLFGGDQLDQLIADTWTFDGKEWSQRKPALSPAPRAGHAMLWMPKAKTLLLLGGYGYGSGGGYHGQYYKIRPLDAWTYDSKSDKWALIKVFTSGKQSNPNCYNSFLKAAVSDDDVLAVQAGRQGTWLCRLDANRVDTAGTARLGVKPGAVTRREKFYDPKWYTEGLPAANPAKVAASYKALPANKWVRITPPRIPRPNMDWGSAMYLPKLDAIARFSGGHCAYSGTAPQVFDLATGRWSIPFAPEFPMDHCCSDGGVPGDWSFKGRPWMPGHTWKATGVDKSGGRLVYLGPRYTWFFDPAKKAWQRSSATHRWRDVRKATLCRTPKGAVVLSDLKRRSHRIAFFLIDDTTGEWKQMPLSGTLPGMSIDSLSTVYDSKRDRILIIAPREKSKPGSVVSYDMKSGEVKWLNPAGREKAVARMRESVYLPDADMVMTGGRVKGPGGKLVWTFYDCAKNKWRVCDFPGDDPLTKRGKKIDGSVSIGLMYDTKRKLVWMVGQYSELTVLKFDPKTAGLKDLK
jgi:hypothetical protein